MSVRGIDTQMMATKPMDMAAQQSKVNKQNETQMAQNATVITKNAELDAERPVAAANAEGKKIGTEEREKGSGSRRGEKKKEPEKQDNKEWVDPMLSLPVEKGKFAKPQKHYINIEV